MIRQNVALGSIFCVDEARGWDRLHAYYNVMRIDHSVALSVSGACTSHAESCFSRPRRVELGQHHYISGKHLLAYAVEMGWREDRRWLPNGRCIKPRRRWRSRYRGSGRVISSGRDNLPNLRSSKLKRLR